MHTYPIDRLRELLSYCPTSGTFTWKQRDRSHFKSSRICNSWNAKNAGNIAGSAGVRGYIYIQIGEKKFRAHRLAWAMLHGEWPTQEIDHINGVTGDNRIANLRPVSRSENSRNLALRETNDTGVMGIKRNYRKWEAAIGIDGKHIYLGLFDTKEEAEAARKSAETAFGFHPNHGRASPLSLYKERSQSEGGA